MSKSLTTLEGTVIRSFADPSETYFLSAGEGTHFLQIMAEAKEIYGRDEYCALMKELWENYLDKEEKPKLLELTLSDGGLVIETIHLIAPRGFRSSTGTSPLQENRESFVYWLTSQYDKIERTIRDEAFEYLRGELQLIIHENERRKKLQK